MPKTWRYEQRHIRSQTYINVSFLRDINEMVNSVVMVTKNSCDKKAKGLSIMPNTRSL